MVTCLVYDYCHIKFYNPYNLIFPSVVTGCRYFHGKKRQAEVLGEGESIECQGVGSAQGETHHPLQQLQEEGQGVPDLYR